MIVSMNHVSFTVSDLAQSVDFYSKVLGLECISLAERDEAFSSAVTGIPGVSMNIAYMKAPNCSVELIQYVTGAGCRLDTATNNTGSAHVCFNISGFDAWIEKMRANSVSMCGELCTVPAGPNKGRHVCYMEDPDGNHLEFMEQN